MRFDFKTEAGGKNDDDVGRATACVEANSRTKMEEEGGKEGGERWAVEFFEAVIEGFLEGTRAGESVAELLRRRRGRREGERGRKEGGMVSECDDVSSS